MTWFIIAAIVIYFLIGGVCAACVDDQELTVSLLLGWPLFMTMALVVGIGLGFLELGKLIVTHIKRYFIDESKEDEVQ